MSPSPKSYFPSLGALRFYAALTIVLVHIPSFTYFFGTPVMRFPVEWFTIEGTTLFFVMSGFLVTLSLLRAIDNPDGLQLRRFYSGRALRIAPMYIAVILVTLLLFAYTLDMTSLILAVTFMIPIARVLLTTPLIHFWTLCVEEHFIWLLAALVKRCNILHLFYAAIGLRGVMFAVANALPTGDPLQRLLMFYQWDALALSGILAVHYHRGAAWLRHLYRYKGFVALLALIVIIAPNPAIWEDDLPVYFAWRTFAGVSLALLLFDLATNPKPIIRLENAVTRFLGTITYGIFAFHIVVIGVLARTLQPTTLETSHVDAALYYLLVIGVTMVVGWLAHTIIEVPFMTLRERWRKGGSPPSRPITYTPTLDQPAARPPHG